MTLQLLNGRRGGQHDEGRGGGSLAGALRGSHLHVVMVAAGHRELRRGSVVAGRREEGTCDGDNMVTVRGCRRLRYHCGRRIGRLQMRLRQHDGCRGCTDRWLLCN